MARQFKPGQLRTGSLYDISSSFALTASYVANGGGGTNINTGSFVTTSSFNAFTASYTTGSFTGSFTGNLIGSSSFAGTASYVQLAQSASYALYAVSASYEINYETSSSYAETASIAISSSYTSTASFYQETDPIFVAKSASLATTGSNNFNGNQTITGSLIQGLEGNIATGENSHAEGSITKAIGDYSHAEGDFTQAVGNYSHAEGQETIASGSYSHAEGYGTIALGDRQHVTGQYNFVSPVQSAFIVGNGTDNNNRSNLIYAAGNEVQISGSLTVNNGITGSLFGTASWAINAVSASFAPNYVLTSTTSSMLAPYVLTSSTASMTVLSSSFATTASYVQLAISASYAPDTTFPFTGSALITGSLGVTGSITSRITSPGSYIWVNHFTGERYDSTTLQGRVYIKTNYPFVEDFYIGKNNGTANNDTSTNGGIHYSHQGQFTVRNTQTSGFYGVTLNADQNLTQRVGIDAGRDGFGLGWSLRNFTNSTDYINFAHNSNRVGIGWNDKTTSLLGATLDVKATGSLSSDIALRVRNSANNANILTVNGDNSAQIGSDTTSGGKLTIAASNTATLNLDTSFSIDTATISVARRISPTFNTNALLFSQNAFSDGNVQPYKFHFVNPSTYWGYSEPGFSMIRDAGFMFFKDSATFANLQMKLTPDNVLTMYTGSLGAIAIPTENPITGSAFQLYASASTPGNIQPHFRTNNGTTVWLGSETRLFNVTASAITASSVTASLLGTASYAIQALSASFAPSTPTFPFTGSALITGSLGITGSVSITQNLTSSRVYVSSSNGTVSGSSLTVYGSGSAQPVFTVQGSQGELFSITDSLSGSLFSVNDISGLPILEVFSDNTTLIGDYQDPMLITTKKVVMTNSGSFTVYGLPTASYDTAFYDYSIRSGSNARAGQIMAIQSGSSVNFTETTTTDFGNTTAVSFTVIVSGSNMVLTGSAATGSWTTKCIIRGL